MTEEMQSAQALKDLQTVCDIKTLGDLTDEEFEAHKDAIKDEVARKRASMRFMRTSVPSRLLRH